MELTELEQEEIAELIKQGFTSGLVDSDNTRVAWTLHTHKWTDDEED